MLHIEADSMMENTLIVSVIDIVMDSVIMIYCEGVDGQVFDNLTAGSYSLFIEATAIENTNEVAYDRIGPIVLAIGANASISEAIGSAL